MVCDVHCGHPRQREQRDDAMSFASGITALTEPDQRRIAVACQVFRASWQSVQRLPIDECAGFIPEPIRAVALRELVMLELELRWAAGETPTLAEYSERFPQLVTDRKSTRLNSSHG